MPNSCLKLSEAGHLYNLQVFIPCYFWHANGVILYSYDPNVFPSFLDLKQHSPSLVSVLSVIAPTRYEHKS